MQNVGVYNLKIKNPESQLAHLVEKEKAKIQSTRKLCEKRNHNSCQTYLKTTWEDFAIFSTEEKEVDGAPNRKYFSSETVFKPRMEETYEAT